MYTSFPGERRDRGRRPSARLRRSFSYLLLASLLAGCGASGSEDEDATSSSGPSEPIVSLIASPANVSDNGYSTLTWSAQNHYRCEASGGWSGTKGDSGSVTVGPLTVSTVYILACRGIGGMTTQAATVTVGNQPPPPAPTVSLTANPTSVGSNEGTTLTWSSSGADGCEAFDGWSGLKPTAGSEAVGPLVANTTFTLVCSNAGGATGQSVTVTVNAAPPPPVPTVTFSANPAFVTQNGSSTLAWTSTDATTCTAGGAWSGFKAVNGSQVVGPLTATSTYTLTCTGPGGSAGRSVTVTVEAPNGTADLTWTAPLTNEDGSPLTLASFNIYKGSSPSNLQKIASVAASQTTYTVNSLPDGTHYFAVTAVSDTGAESTFSNVESKTIF